MDWRAILWNLVGKHVQPAPPRQYPVQPLETMPRHPIKTFPCGCEAYEGQFHFTYLKKCKDCKVSKK